LHLSEGQIKTLFSPELSLVEERLRQTVQAESRQLSQIAQYILGLGGKRLRPLLALICSDIYGAEINARVEIATAAELIHTASLLHDDVVDEADWRRGQPSANRRWGNPGSVLAGDFLFARAFSILSKFPDALEIMTDAIAAMCQAELIQLGSQFNPDTSPETYVRTIMGKTASLLAASCHCGSLISKMPREEAGLVRTYGMHLGIAYQIIDDIGDYVLGKSQSGKSQGSELKNGIITLPLLYILATPRGKRRIRDLLEDYRSLGPEMLVGELRETRALERAAEVAGQHIEKAREKLHGLPRCRATQALDGLAAELLKRCANLSDYPAVPQSPGHSFQHPGP
jgi:geranylgeranyl pyrophosphate synthase